VRAILGSASTGLLQHAGAPVLVVPEKTVAADGPVVIGYDESDHAERAIDACGRLLSGRRALVVRVWRSLIRHSLTGRAMQHAPLQDIRETVTEFDTMFETWARETLLDIARDADAAAIVLGRRGRGAVASTVLGSVSLSLLHAADRPVLVA
jgi:hypothetical protein